MDTEQEKKKFYYELMLEGTRGKFSTLLYISSLTAALLVIGSFDGNLFPLNNLVRFIISVLLVLMVYCVEVYLSQVTKLSSDAAKELFGENRYPVLTRLEAIKFLLTGFEKNKKDERNFRDRLHAVFPDLALWILWLVVIVLIVLVWVNAYPHLYKGLFNYLITTWNIFF
ncbi:MAG: hypothetical protein HYT40_00840 [Candidatus Sungbacteria bacterium]|uniref:Uncharacterized protein n=1 Tax=Candidatus Sungiibacteriota bacterium TaxID=2750080 RepID=A0A931SB13_9BACT|nr:hypothetical protein [Candidatus Sungbacteria bacterium]